MDRVLDAVQVTVLCHDNKQSLGPRFALLFVQVLETIQATIARCGGHDATSIVIGVRMLRGTWTAIFIAIFQALEVVVLGRSERSRVCPLAPVFMRVLQAVDAVVKSAVIAR